MYFPPEKLEKCRAAVLPLAPTCGRKSQILNLADNPRGEVRSYEPLDLGNVCPTAGILSYSEILEWMLLPT